MANIIDYEYDGRMNLVTVTISDDGDVASFRRERKARWEEYPDFMHLRCTGCKTEFHKDRIPPKSRYCPHCGSWMTTTNISK